jgi:hypothetical protein
MNRTLVLFVLVLAGGVGGYLFGSSDMGAGRAGRSDAVAFKEVERLRIEDRAEIDRLKAELDRLRGLLAARTGDGDEEPVPYADDTPEKVERLLQDAFEENNVDWLIEVIERLLRMGERGYPLLRRLIEDIAFKAKFLPAQSDFRIDQLYKVGRVFANLEPQFIGFLNYLLVDADRRTHPWFKQAALMGGAFYVGSNAKGSDELKQTMMQLFLQDTGGMLPGVPERVQRRMNVFAMAMSGDKRMIGPLRDELNKSKDKGEQGDIIGALAYLGDPEVVPLVQERLDPREGDFRKELRALGRIGTDEAHGTATNFLRSIPDSKRFYRHTREYMRNGGGSAAVYLIKERFEANPSDKEVNSAIGSLRRFPTKESLDTLNTIATQSPDKEIQKRATDAAADVERRLRGEIPNMPER